MSLVSDVLGEAAKITNEILGEPCQYVGIADPIYITIDKNIKVFSEIGVFQGFRSEASILISDTTPKVRDTFVDPTGQEWLINMVTKQTSSKTYVDIIEN